MIGKTFEMIIAERLERANDTTEKKILDSWKRAGGLYKLAAELVEEEETLPDFFHKNRDKEVI